ASAARLGLHPFPTRRSSDLCEVSVLCRREEHARDLAAHGLRVTGKHEFVASVSAATSPEELEEPDLVVVATKATELEAAASRLRSEEHTSELQSRGHVVCRL